MFILTTIHNQPGAAGAGERVRTIAGFTFLVVVVLVTFGQISNWAFLSYDDNIHIVRNPWLNPPTWETLKQFWQGPYWGEYVPLAYTLWAWEAYVSQRSPEGALQPWVFHFGNIALHAIATGTTFLVVKEFTTRIGPAILAGLLFGLHPLQVEAVAWISETRGLLSGLFGLLAIWLYIGFTIRLPDKQRQAILWYTAATVAFVLALLSKSSAVAIVPMVAVIDLLLLKRRSLSIAFAIFPWAAAAGAMAWMMTSQQGIGSIAYRPVWAERIFMAGDAVAFYLGKLVWPVGLCADYGWYPQFMREQPWFYVLPIVPLVLLVVGWLLRRRIPLLVGLLLFVAGISPVLGLVPFTYQSVSLVADRFVYLAMLGPALMLGLLTRRLPAKWIAGMAVAVAGLLAPLSWQQSQVWRTDLTLAIHAREINRRSIFAASTIAQNMMHQGENELAFNLCVEIAQLNPYSARALINLAQIYSFHGQTEGAIKVLESALALHPTSSFSHRLMAESLEQEKQFEEALVHYRLSLDYGRKDADRAALHVRIGSLLILLKRPQEAAEAFQAAIDTLPEGTSDIWLGLGQAHMLSGEFNAALKATKEADAALAKTGKTSPEIYLAIAQTYHDLGQVADSLRVAKQATAVYRQNDNVEGIRRVEQLIEAWSAKPNRDEQ